MRRAAFSTLLCGVLVALVLSVVLTTQVHSQGQGLPTREDIQGWISTNLTTLPQFKEGDVLRQADLEKLRPFLPPRYLDEFDFPEVEFVLRPRAITRPHPDYLSATEQYSNQTRLAPTGRLRIILPGGHLPRR